MFRRATLASIVVLFALTMGVLIFPAMTAAQDTSMNPSDFRADMRKLWEDHIQWTRNYIISVAADLPDAELVAERLLQNQDDIGDAIRPFYGDEAGDQLTQLLRDHIMGAVDILTAAVAGDTAAMDTAVEAWRANGDDIATFLNGANPDNWSLEDLQAEMQMHLDLTLAEAQARLSGDYAADIAAYDNVHDHILAFSDVLSNGIIAQFPEMFGGAEAAGDHSGMDMGGGTASGAITVSLTGAAEVPGPGDEDAAGTAVVYLRTDSNEVCVDISVQNITLPAAAAHIHQAPAGEAGPPVVTLTAPAENGLSSTCATVEATLMQELVNNPQNFYVNVHNADFPDGAARGQLVGSGAGAGTVAPEATAEAGTTDGNATAGVITVSLTGAAEVPGPGDEDAAGTAVVYLRSDSNEVCVDINVQNITLPAAAAHIHQAAAGQAGPPVVTLTAPGADGLSSTCATIDAALMQDMVVNPQNYYVNVHNADFPDGAARGQFG